MTPIRMSALRHSAFYTPYLMTIAGGFLREQGLVPEYQPATPEQPLEQGLREGRWHLGQSAVATSFAALEAGTPIDLVHFAAINSRDGFFLAAREPQPSFNWAALKGKRVLVDHFFQPLAMFRYALHQAGLAFDDIEVIDGGDPQQMERAFRQGVADYVHLQGPAPQQLERDGEAHVVAAVGAAIGPVAFSSLCAPRSWLETEMARAFMAAYRSSLDYVTGAPADELAARHHEAGFLTDIDRPVLAATITAYQLLGCWQAEPAIGEADYERLLDIFLFGGVISRRHPYDAAIVPPPLAPT